MLFNKLYLIYKLTLNSISGTTLCLHFNVALEPRSTYLGTSSSTFTSDCPSKEERERDRVSLIKAGIGNNLLIVVALQSAALSPFKCGLIEKPLKSKGKAI